MARPVRQFEPLWFDRTFKRELRRLPQSQQEERLHELAALAVALGECTHPTHDQRLASWRPSAYHVPRVSSQIRLCEYRCAYPLRVIIRWIEPSEEEPEGVVLLVAATLSHDHDRLKEIISRHRSDL
jgi:hypothetical protein